MTTTFLSVLISYLFLSLGLVIAYGHYSPSAFLATVLGIISLVFSFFSSFRKKNKILHLKSMTNGFIIGIFFSLLLLIASPALIYSQVSARILFLFFVFPVSALLFGCFRYRHSPKLSLVFILSLLFLWILFSILVIKVSPNPAIDVWYQHQEGAKAFLAGKNPYQQAFSMPIQSNQYEVTSLYPYPPYSLLLTTPFYFLLGDIRYAYIICQLLAAFFLFKISKRINGQNEIALLISALFLFNPRWPFVLEQAWTESGFVVLLFASCYFLHCSFFNRGAFLSGIFLAAKPYLPPLIFLEASSLKKNKLAVLVGVLAFFIFPLIFIFWSPSHFYQNVIQFHLNSSFRLDSLSLNAFLMKNFSWHLPFSISFALLFILLILGMRQKEIFKKFLFASLAYYLFFWLNKQAFCNYYFFVEALLVLVLALIPCHQSDNLTGLAEKPI